MIDVSDEKRYAFTVWLRTGRLPPAHRADGLEFKFNPYHDPRDGRFTFAPGGPRAQGKLGSGYAGSQSRSVGSSANSRSAGEVVPQAASSALRNVSETWTAIDPRLVPGPQRPLLGRGGNIRAFEDPMTLEHSFPGLGSSPGGAIVAVADTLFDLTGPANAMTAEVLQNHARQIMEQIKAIDPGWYYDETVPTDALGNSMQTVDGFSAKVNDLRFQRAVVVARLKGNYELLQVETLRFVQQRANLAYDRGVALLKAGRITPRLSDQEALGNYIDRQVRLNLRDRYNVLGIDSAGAGPVRVNRRENNSSGSDLTYRLPDARVKDVAFDVTLTRKTLSTSQVRGFFEADFRPSRVIIIRPRQIGADHTYAILRPETQR